MLTRDNIADVYSLAPMQESMFFDSLRNPASNTYFEQLSFRQNGVLDITSIEAAFNVLLERHDVLRAVFVQKTTDRPLQVIMKERRVPFFFRDLRGEADPQGIIDAYRKQDEEKGFQLAQDVLMRVAVLQLEDELYELVWTWHHILMDAWCVQQLQQEFFRIYAAIVSGQKIVLPPVKPYKKYIEWLNTRDLAAGRLFWEEYLQGYEDLASLHPLQRQTGEGYGIRKADLLLDEKLSADLKALAAACRVTISTLCQAIWGVLLSKYHGSPDVIFGSVVSGRPPSVEGIETMMGLFINTLPVRLRYEGAESFATLLKSMQKNAVNAESHHYLSLAEIQAASAQRQPLFDHILLFQNFPVTGMTADAGSAPAAAGPLQLHKTTSFQRFFYDLNIFFFTGGPGLFIEMKFNEQVYEPAFAAQVLQHFRVLAQQVTANPDMAVKDLLLTDQDTRELLTRFSGSNSSVSYAFSDLKALLEHQVAATPNLIAVHCNGRELSYRELHRQANMLAGLMTGRYGIGTSAVVAIMMPRSEMLVAALLAVIKTGAAFLPIDAAMPAARKHSILQEAQVSLLIIPAGDMLEVVDFYGGPVLAPDVEMPLEQEAYNNPAIALQPQDLAYVLYTSGSSGQPKGVGITHGSFSNYVQWANSYYFKEAARVIFPFFTALSFDLTLTSIFTTLTNGGALHVYESDDVHQVLDHIFRHPHINTVKLTPAHISLLPHLQVPATGITRAIVGGEALTALQIDTLKMLNSSMHVYNEYGPTEATIGCTVKEVMPGEKVSVGYPVANAAIYILDENRQLQAPGIAGEIFIGGKVLAAGYYHNAGLTEEKFVPSPFDPAARLYRSGDKGRWWPDGQLEYLGRIDQQVKIRGYRVELQEVEHAVLQHEAVQAAVVTDKLEQSGSRSLLTFIVWKHNPQPAALRRHLETVLPSYMIPSRLVDLSEIPLTANGKVNRKLLAAMENSTPQTQQDAPVTATEAALAVIWKDVLGLSEVGIRQRFYETGGHSLTAIQLIARIYKQFHVQLDISTIFEEDTIEKQAACIDGTAPAVYEPLEKLPDAPFYETSYAQKSIWIAERLLKDKTAYIIPRILLLKGTLDVAVLQEAFRRLLQRYEILRTTFALQGEEPVQYVHSADSFNCSLEYQVAHPSLSLEDVLESPVVKGMMAPLDLEKGPLIRCRLILVQPDQYILCWALHHIITDGQSMDNLLTEFTALCNTLAAGGEPLLPPVNIQYRDYAAWHNAQLQTKKGMAAREYWFNKFSDLSPSALFPSGAPAAQAAGNTAMVSCKVPPAMYQRLQGLCSEHNCSMFMPLMAALKILLYKHSGYTDLTVGTVAAGRVHPDLESQLGVFMNTLMLRTRLLPDSSIKENLLQVKDTVLEAFRHQLFPYSQLVQHISRRQGAGRQRFFDVMLSYHRTPGPQPAANGVQPLQVAGYTLEKKAITSDIILDVADTGAQLHADMIFHTHAIDNATAAGLCDGLLKVLAAITEQQYATLEQLQTGMEKAGTTTVVTAPEVFNFDFNYK